MHGVNTYTNNHMLGYGPLITNTGGIKNKYIAVYLFVHVSIPYVGFLSAFPIPSPV